MPKTTKQGAKIEFDPDRVFDFLATTAKSAFDHGVKTREDFLIHFPPSGLMQEFLRADADAELRAVILEKNCNTPREVGRELDLVVAGTYLQSYYDKGKTSAKNILEADEQSVGMQMWVRHVPEPLLWKFMTHIPWWDEKGSEDVRHFVAGILEHLLEAKVITREMIIDLIGLDQLMKQLQRNEIENLVSLAVNLSKGGTPCTPHAIFDHLGASRVVEAVGTDLVYHEVIRHVAAAWGLTEQSLEAEAVGGAAPPGGTQRLGKGASKDVDAAWGAAPPGAGAKG